MQNLPCRISKFSVVFILALILTSYTLADILKEDSIKFSDDLQFGDWKIKAKAAEKIIKATDITIEKKSNLFVSALEKERMNKTSDEIPLGSYKTISVYLKDEYVFAITKLGIQVVPCIKKHLNKTEGETKDRLTLVLGLLKIRDEKVSSKIIQLAQSSQDGYIRALAMRVLCDWEDEALIHIFKNGLKDNFKINVKTDLITPNAIKGEDGYYFKVYYPVRNEASSALRKLGVKMERKGQEFIIKE